MAVKLGVFVVPDATDAGGTLEQFEAAEKSGLDLVAVQDHPYQRRFFDTWTLLSFAAARTERVRFLTDVANLPLRPPAMLAKAAASLDLLSDGRLELGIGAGAFWDAVEAMGGPRRTPKESVDALEEAIEVLRQFWDMHGPVTVEGDHYTVKGAKPGPPPAHRIGIWIGAYGPRMLRLTGRLGDGWIPSLGDDGYMSPDDVPRMQAAVDEGARSAGRDPSEIERGVNTMSLAGDVKTWPEQLARVHELGFTTMLVALPRDDPTTAVRRLGEEVRPRLLELSA